MTSIDDSVTEKDSARDGVSPSVNWHLKFADCILKQIDEKVQGKSQ
jgi:hypothetical protein